MKVTRILALGVMAWSLIAATSAYAHHVSGQVRCPNGTVYPGVIVWAIGTSAAGQQLETWTTTDSDGLYYHSLPTGNGNYVISLQADTLPPDATVPAGVPIQIIVPDQTAVVADFEVDSSICEEGVAWFTGGGAKIDNLLGIATARATKASGKSGGGPELSFGGNVYPGCSPTAGDGGSWNHVDRALNLHFHGTTIVVTKVGNVPGIPPGSTSPKTPFNFLECTGTGWLKGIQGNKTNLPLVYFDARFEDHNEPGSKGTLDGSLTDRYYLRVYDGSGTTLLLVSEDLGNPLNILATVPITDGNFQLHISSCDNPPTP